MAKQRGKHDQNFDMLIGKFEQQVYSTFKGEWRLKLLQEDLRRLHQKASMDVWDAGCGMGQMALWFAKGGHRLTCNDISYKMLEKAKAAFVQEGCAAVFHKAPLQEIVHRIDPQDLVLFHAVLEWLAHPMENLEIVARRVKPGGYLSLLFYNYHSFIYRNALKGTWRLGFLLDPSKWWGRGKKLTPPHPQKPEEIIVWLEAHGFEIEVVTGIRVFHDYMEKEVLDGSSMDELSALEYRYCREPVYSHMGRYVHVMARNLF